MMATRILRRSQSVSVVLSYTGGLFFPLLSVYASCSSSIRYTLRFYKLNRHEFNRLSDSGSDTEEVLQTAAFLSASGSVPEVEC